MLQHSGIRKGNKKMRKRTFRFSISMPAHAVTRHAQRIETLNLVAYVRCKASTNFRQFQFPLFSAMLFYASPAFFSLVEPILGLCFVCFPGTFLVRGQANHCFCASLFSAWQPVFSVQVSPKHKKVNESNKRVTEQFVLGLLPGAGFTKLS